MKKRLLLLSIFFVLSIGLVFELGLLFFVFGEPKEIRLGGDDIAFLANLAEQIRLGRIVEVEGGELAFFFGGRLHQFHVLSVQERLGVALSNALRGNYGQASSYNGAVSDYLLPSLGWSALAYLGMLLGSSTAVLAPKVKLSKRVGYIVLGCGGGLLLLAHVLTPLVPSLYPLGIVLLCLALGCIGLWIGQGRPWKRNLCEICFLTVGGALSLFLLGLSYKQCGGTLDSLFVYALYNQDDHLYSVAFFFMMFLPVLVLFGGLLLRVFFNKKLQKEAVAEQA